jgi:cobalt/nickel transport system permease protein
MCLATAPLAAAAVGVSLWKWRGELRQSPATAPSIFQAAAVGNAVFALQMCNVAIPGEHFSGHILGGAFATILLGPWAACCVMAMILTIQAGLFADGGLTALGANILNMGVITCGVTALMLRLTSVLQPTNEGVPQTLASRSFIWFAATTASVLTAVISLALQLALGATTEIDVSQTTLLLLQTHWPIALGEGVATATGIAALVAFRGSRQAAILMGLSLVLILGAAPFASELPDGLEATGEVAGFLGSQWSINAFLPDYSVPGIGTPFVSTIMAGMAGMLLTVAGILVLQRLFLPHHTGLETPSP